MIGLVLDLARQVRGLLLPAHGGTGNARAWGAGTVLSYSNRTGSALPLMTVVRPVVAGGPRVEPVDTDAETDVLGVVVGYFDIEGKLIEDDAADNSNAVAVLVDGVTQVLTAADVDRGDYAFASTTAGQAYGDPTAAAGAFGQFLGRGGAGQYAPIRVVAASAATGGGGSGGAPSTADYLVGTTQPGLSAEIVVGTTPGGELGGTWGSPTVDTTHSGSSHASKAPVGAAYLTATSDPDLTAEVVVGTTPGGELGGTWGSPTVDTTHSGSSHAATAASAVTTAETYSDAADATHAALPNVHHARQHASTSTSDHTFPGGTTTFLRADGAYASPGASGAGGSAKGWVGDGSDGVIVLDGTNTFSYLNKTGNVYGLTRDVLASTLTIDAGKTLLTNGYRLYCTGTLTVNGTLSSAGGDAVTTTGGTAADAVGAPVLGGSQAGANGRANIVAAGNSTVTLATAAAGGRGGSGGSATGAGGTAGTVGPTRGGGNFRSLPWSVTGQLSGSTAGPTFSLVVGGTGGGGGACNSATTTSSGAGGGGGGTMIVCATTIIVGAAGVITVQGGAGSNASGTGAAGGGGGGGGGVMVLLYETLSNAGTITAAGGLHGNGVNGGNNGADGSAGVIVQHAMV